VPGNPPLFCSVPQLLSLGAHGGVALVEASVYASFLPVIGKLLNRTTIGLQLEEGH
jgi:hypothetical protein